MSEFEYIHTVGFEETSLIGNVYFANYLLWQGHCREMFLRQHAPEVIEDLRASKIALFTRSCSCDFHGDAGFEALDDVLVRMRLEKFRGGRMTLGFDYVAPQRGNERVASGTQQIACKHKCTKGWVPAPFPPALVRALLEFTSREDLRGALQDALDYQDNPIG